MTTAQLSSLAWSASSYGSSYMSISHGDGTTTISLNADEKAQIAHLALQLFHARQSQIAADIAAIAPPAALPAPATAIIEGHSEVVAEDEQDDCPF